MCRAKLWLLSTGFAAHACAFTGRALAQDGPPPPFVAWADRILQPLASMPWAGWSTLLNIALIFALVKTWQRARDAEYRAASESTEVGLLCAAQRGHHWTAEQREHEFQKRLGNRP